MNGRGLFILLTSVFIYEHNSMKEYNQLCGPNKEVPPPPNAPPHNYFLAEDLPDQNPLEEEEQE